MAPPADDSESEVEDDDLLSEFNWFSVFRLRGRTPQPSSTIGGSLVSMQRVAGPDIEVDGVAVSELREKRILDNLTDEMHEHGTALAGDGEAQEAEAIRAASSGDGSNFSLKGYVRYHAKAEMRTEMALTEPSSFHQATVYFSIKKESSTASTQVLYLSGSFLLVCLQAIVASAVAASATNPGCSNSDHCISGMFCDPDGSFCVDCSWPSTNCEDDEAGDDDWSTACCADGDYMKANDTINENLRIMTLFDRVTFVLATLVVAMSAQNEVRDMLICNSSVEQVSHALREKGHGSRGLAAKQIFMSTLALMRQVVFLPLLCYSVQVLVLYQGGSAVDICLNAVAVLFLTELDNAAFYFGMNEMARNEVLEFGRTDMTTDLKCMINHVKRVYMVIIPLMMIWTVLESDGNAWLGLFVSPLPFIIGEFVEAFWRKKSCFGAFGRVLVRSIIGYVVYIGFAYGVHFSNYHW